MAKYHYEAAKVSIWTGSKWHEFNWDGDIIVEGDVSQGETYPVSGEITFREDGTMVMFLWREGDVQ